MLFCSQLKIKKLKKLQFQNDPTTDESIFQLFGAQ